MQLVAIVAHPDDAAIFCGGTLAKHAARGDDVAVLHMTRGEYGGTEATEAAVAERREAEAVEAADTLGIETGFLGFEDGRVTYSLEARLALVDVIREYTPDVVLTHFREDMHPDHRVTSRLVTDAYYMASLPLVETGHAPHDPRNVLYFGKPTSSFAPETFVDVTDTEATKEEAIRCHESQVEFLEAHGGIDAEFSNLVEGVRAEGRVLGRQAGCRFAEGFVPLHETAAAYLEA